MERPQLHPEHQGSLCPVLPSSHKWNCRKSALFHQKRLKGHADGYGSGVQTRLVSPLTLGPPFTKGGPHPQDRCQFSQTTPRPKPYSARSVGGSPHPAHVGRGPQGPGEPSRSLSRSGDRSNVLTLEEERGVHANYHRDSHSCLCQEGESHRATASLYRVQYKIVERPGHPTLKVRMGTFKSGVENLYMNHWQNCKPAKLREGAKEAEMPTRGGPKKTAPSKTAQSRLKSDPNPPCPSTRNQFGSQNKQKKQK